MLANSTTMRYRPIAPHQSEDLSSRVCLMRHETSELTGPQHFRLSGCRIGALSLARHDSRGVEHGQRTAQHIKSKPQDSFIFFVPILAEFNFAQVGRHTEISAGTAVLLSSRHPFDAYASGATLDATLSSYQLCIPEPLLRARVPYVDDLYNREICISSGVGKILQSVLQTSLDEAEWLDQGQAERLSLAAVELAASCIESFDQDQEPLQRVSSASASIFKRAMAFIESRLSNPELDAELIAHDCRVSRRSLDVVFQKHGVSVASSIRDMRLQRCRMALQNPRMAMQSVNVIASYWGFTDASHFGRLYKQRFGIQPGQERRP